MPPLICSFASRHSAPDRIQRWIDHLNGLRASCPDDVDFQQQVEAFLEMARDWLPRRPASEPAGRRAHAGS